MTVRSSLLGVASVTICALAACQAVGQSPRIETLFPVGGKAGSTVEVEIRGSGVDGAERLLVAGAGVTGDLHPADAKPDATNKPVWQAHCQSCHELRSPANRSLTPTQWAATVERMVKAHGAPISADDQAKVTSYLVGLARAGKVTAALHIAPDAVPGVYEVRVVTRRGVSTAGRFEVGSLPEFVAVNGRMDAAQSVSLPCAVEGCFTSNAERHFFRFAAEKGKRLVFDLKGFRYNPETQMFFNPGLFLYDSSGKEIANDHGYYELDPLVDWTCPASGDYTIEVRDLLWHGNPGSVYRLTMGELPYDTSLYPPAGQAGVKVECAILGKDADANNGQFAVSVPRDAGLRQVDTPYGSQPMLISAYPVVEASPTATATLPACLVGRFSHQSGAAVFTLQGKGPFRLQGYAAKLGSAVDLRAALQDSKGRTIDSFNGEGRMRVTLDPAQKYTLRVEDTATDADGVFAVEARPSSPEVACVARPANVSLRPGLSAAVQVIVTRRSGVAGDIALSVADLPPGVTAQPAVIQADRDTAWLVLTAAPDAKPSAVPVRIIAHAHGRSGEADAEATPQEIYRLNNEPRAVDCDQFVVAVCGPPDYIPTLESPPTLLVHPKREVELKVRLERRAGYRSGVTLYVEGLPSGWTANPVGVGPDQSEPSIRVRPDGNNPQPFLRRSASSSPIRAVVIAEADDFRFVAGTLTVLPAPDAERRP